MKKSMLLFLISICYSSMFYGQSVNSIIESGYDANPPGGLPVKGQWFGSQIGYMLNDSEEFSDNLLVSAKIVQELEFLNINMPLVGNFSDIIEDKSAFKDSISVTDSKIKELMNANRGLHIGFYPYEEVMNTDFLALTAHGSFGYKLNAFENPDTTEESSLKLDQFRFSAGLEVTLKFKTKGGDDGAASKVFPVILSVTPAWTFFSESKYNEIFGNERNSLGQLEFTGVVPLFKGLGFMVEYINPFDKELESSFRTGIIYNFKPE